MSKIFRFKILWQAWTYEGQKLALSPAEFKDKIDLAYLYKITDFPVNLDGARVSYSKFQVSRTPFTTVATIEFSQPLSTAAATRLVKTTIIDRLKVRKVQWFEFELQPVAFSLTPVDKQVRPPANEFEVEVRWAMEGPQLTAKKFRELGVDPSGFFTDAWGLQTVENVAFGVKPFTTLATISFRSAASLSKARDYLRRVSQTVPAVQVAQTKFSPQVIVLREGGAPRAQPKPKVPRQRLVQPRVPEANCVAQTSKKYTSRKAPPYLAQHPACQNTIKRGNDNVCYKSVGVFKWVKQKNATC